MTHTSDVIAYFNIVTRETVYFALNVAALHDLEVKEVELLNMYVTIPNREKIWVVLRPKFWDNDD